MSDNWMANNNMMYLLKAPLAKCHMNKFIDKSYIMISSNMEYKNTIPGTCKPNKIS